MTNPFSNKPFGIFDSGVGGLFVLKEIQKYLPNESFVYLADSANAPYGEKTPSQILNFSLNAGRFLYNQQIKGLIIACNTASCYSSEILKATLDIPVFDVIEPTISFFTNRTDLKKVLLLATNATVNSQVFQKRLMVEAPWMSITSLGCPEFVEEIEKINSSMSSLFDVVREKLSLLPLEPFDAIILGCTHFLCLEEIIQSLFPKACIIVPTAKLLGNHIQTRLPSFPLSPPTQKFYTSGDPEKFKKSLAKFVHYTGPNIFSTSLEEVFC